MLERVVHVAAAQSRSVTARELQPAHRDLLLEANCQRPPFALILDAPRAVLGLHILEKLAVDHHAITLRARQHFDAKPLATQGPGARASKKGKEGERRGQREREERGGRAERVETAGIPGGVEVRGASPAP